MLHRRSRGVYDDVDEKALKEMFRMTFAYMLVVESEDGEILGLFTEYDKLHEFMGIVNRSLTKERVLLKVNGGLIYQPADLSIIIKRVPLDDFAAINNVNAFLENLVKKGCEIDVTGRIDRILKVIDSATYTNLDLLSPLDKHYLATISKFKWK